jgi:hypothetical protein
MNGRSARIKQLIVKITGELSEVFERGVAIPFKINFSASVDSAIREAVVYRENSYGFKSCLLFCHYNPHGLVLQQVRDLCLFFKSHHIDVVFITTKVDASARAWIKENLSALLIRENLGRDFGAWKDGVSFLRNENLFESCDSIYLINDSFLIVSSDLSETPLVNKFIQRQDVDFLGITESWQQSYHLQSYCLKLNRPILQSKFFEHYWSNYLLINSRLYSIENGEILFSQSILSEGFSVDVVYPTSFLVSNDNLQKLSDLLESLNLPKSALDELCNEIFDEIFKIDFTEINPSHRLWTLLLIAKCPIFKRDLIEKNPENLVSMRYFQALCSLVIDKTSIQKLDQSLTHLKYSKKSKKHL